MAEKEARLAKKASTTAPLLNTTRRHTSIQNINKVDDDDGEGEKQVAGPGVCVVINKLMRARETDM